VGSARVWDEQLRAQRVAAGPPERPRPELETAPDELAALIRGIVAVTLDTRLADLDGPRRVALARELETRLGALFGRAEPPSSRADRAQGTAAESTPRHHRALPLPEPDADARAAAQPLAPAEVPAEVASAPAQVLPELPPAWRALELVLEDRLARLGGPLAGRADLRRLLARLALEELRQATPPAAADEESLRSLDVLERRAAKLQRALHDARAALAYVSGLEHVEPGLASIYRAVQGLSGDDPRREQKAGALEKIFQANLALRAPRAD